MTTPIISLPSGLAPDNIPIEGWIPEKSRQMRRWTLVDGPDALHPGRPDLVQNLRKRLEDHTREEGECLIWIGRVEQNLRGYVRTGCLPRSDRPQRMLVNRAAFLLAHGFLPQGYGIWRTCGNSLCVRPDHLIAVCAVPTAGIVNTAAYLDGLDDMRLP